MSSLKDIAARALTRHLAPTHLKENPAGFLTVNPWNVGRSLPHITDYDAVFKAAETEAWAYVGIHTTAKNLSGAPLIVEATETVNGERKWVRQESGPLAELIEAPNEDESMDLFLWTLTAGLFGGDWYVVLDDEHKNAIYNCYPGFIHPVLAEDGSTPFYDLGNGTSRMKRVPAEYVIHLKLPNPSHPHYGLAPMKAAANHVRISQQYLRHVVDFFQNGGMPLGLMTTDSRNVSEEQMAKLDAHWKTKHVGDGKRFQTAWLTSGFKYQQLSPPLAELMVEALWKMPRETILAIFGTPPVLAGIFEYANYANSQQQIQIFWQNSIMPLMRVIAGQLSIQLAKRHFGPDIRLRFDTSQIPALQEDENQKFNRLRIAVGGPWMTANEAREKIGLDPIDGGDEMYGPVAVLQSGGTEEGKAGTLSLGLPNSLRPEATADPRFEAWFKSYKSIVRTQRSFEKLMRREFDKQLDRILKKLKVVSLPNGKMNTALFWAAAVYQGKGAGDDADSIFDIEAETKAMYEQVPPFVRKTVKQAGQEAINSLNIILDFNVNSPFTADMLQQMRNHIKDINETTWEKIRQTFRQAYDENWTLKEIEKSLRETYKQFAGARAKTIATTETTDMIEGAKIEGWKQTGVSGKKTWVSSFLKTSREHHMAASGQTVGLDEEFAVGESQMKWPGDSNGGKGLVGDRANCKCDVQFIADE